MADSAVRATIEIRDATPLLGAIDRNADRLSATSVAVRQRESEADEPLDRGLRALFAGDASAGHKLTVEKVYDPVEAVVDRCEDVVDVIEGIVVEQVQPVATVVVGTPVLVGSLRLRGCLTSSTVGTTAPTPSPPWW